jgi:hypothetical protein
MQNAEFPTLDTSEMNNNYVAKGISRSLESGITSCKVHKLDTLNPTDCQFITSCRCLPPFPLRVKYFPAPSLVHPSFL